jgi:hypothetical protein
MNFWFNRGHIHLLPAIEIEHFPVLLKGNQNWSDPANIKFGRGYVIGIYFLCWFIEFKPFYTK